MSHTLNDHVDVVITNPTLNDMLRYNGDTWVNVIGLSITPAQANDITTNNAKVGTVLGDVKNGFQLVDHGGWVILNGRLTSSLTATQQAQATLLGIGANLTDLTGGHFVITESNETATNGVGVAVVKKRYRHRIDYTMKETPLANGALEHVMVYPEAFLSNAVIIGSGNSAGWRLGTCTTTNTAATFRGYFPDSDVNPTATGVNMIVTGKATPDTSIPETFVYLGL